MSERVRHELRLSEALWERLRERALQERVSQNWLMECAIWEYLGKPADAEPAMTWRPRRSLSGMG